MLNDYFSLVQMTRGLTQDMCAVLDRSTNPKMVAYRQAAANDLLFMALQVWLSVNTPSKKDKDDATV